EASINVAQSLASSDTHFDRAFDRLLGRIARLERRLIFLQYNFAVPYERTNDEPIEVIENTDSAQKTKNAPFPSCNPTQATLAAYDAFFKRLRLEDPPDTGERNG